MTSHQRRECSLCGLVPVVQEPLQQLTIAQPDR